MAKELYAEYIEARAKAWEVHDRLVSEGLNKAEMQSHPDYLLAIETEQTAYRTWLNSEIE